MDPQGNLSMSQGIDPETLEESMFDVLVHDLPIRAVIRRCEVDVAVASIDLAGAEIAMSTKIGRRSEEHTSELQSRQYLVCRLLLEKKQRRVTMPRSEEGSMIDGEQRKTIRAPDAAVKAVMGDLEQI